MAQNNMNNTNNNMNPDGQDGQKNEQRSGNDSQRQGGNDMRSSGGNMGNDSSRNMGNDANRGMDRNSDDSNREQREKMVGAAKETGTEDSTYNLVSILYHALQGAQTYAGYRQDAEKWGDEELVQFIARIQDEERQRAQDAKDLLAERLGDKAATAMASQKMQKPH